MAYSRERKNRKRGTRLNRASSRNLIMRITAQLFFNFIMNNKQK
jgi:hypothetical protein